MELAERKPKLRDLVCFHCQQAAEKHLKALLQEFDVRIPRIHELNQLLKLLLPYDPSLKGLKRFVRSLSRYAVEYRYPGESATSREMRAALRNAERVRTEVFIRLGLPP